jgi:hypothetical protein
MASKDGPEHLVFPRVPGRPTPHERNDVAPRMKTTEEIMPLLESIQEGLVGATADFLFQSFTVFTPRAHKALW